MRLRNLVTGRWPHLLLASFIRVLPFLVTGCGSTAVVSSASNSPGAASTGTGTGGAGIVQPVQYSVDLNWNPSTSAVAGYNVYRGSQSGGPYQILNPSLQSLAFTDSNVQSGTTYYYVVTAVDANGIESAFSDEASAVIPTP